MYVYQALNPSNPHPLSLPPHMPAHVWSDLTAHFCHALAVGKGNWSKDSEGGRGPGSEQARQVEAVCQRCTLPSSQAIPA